MAITSNDNSCEVDLTVTWELTDATISAICVHGEVYNERGLDLILIEGRPPKLFPVNDWLDVDEDDLEFREVLAYELSWALKGSEPPESGQQAEGRVGICGKLADGRHCKIVGRGYIGRDSLGQLDGLFVSPPAIEIAALEERMVEID